MSQNIAFFFPDGCGKEREIEVSESRNDYVTVLPPTATTPRRTTPRTTFTTIATTQKPRCVCTCSWRRFFNHLRVYWLKWKPNKKWCHLTSLLIEEHSSVLWFIAKSADFVWTLRRTFYSGKKIYDISKEILFHRRREKKSHEIQKLSIFNDASCWL